MRVAKEAVGYYCAVTGKEWSEFFNNLDAALSAEEGAPISNELWLIKKLMGVITKSGMTVNEFRINKDAIKGVFDEAARKQAGEFFTPEVWCAEGRKYFDKHIPNWREMNVWDGSCYSMDTEILTKRGWVTYDNLMLGDEIYTLNHNTLHGEWSGFHNAFKKPYAGDMIHIHTGSLDALVTPDHKMFIRKDASEYGFIEASEVAKASNDTNFRMYRAVRNRAVLPKWNTHYAAYFYIMGAYARWGRYVEDKDGDYIEFIFNAKSGSIDMLTLDSALKSLRSTSKEIVLDECDVPAEFKQIPKSERLVAAWRIYNKYILSHVKKYMGTSIETIKMPNVSDALKYHFVNGVSISDIPSHGKLDCDFRKIVVKSKSLFDSLCVALAELGVVYTTREVKCNNEYIINYTLRYDSDHKFISYSGRGLDGTKLGKHELCFSNNSVTVEKYDGYVWDLTTDNDNHIFYVRRNGKMFFGSNCGSGNLMRTAGHPTDKLFLSSLQEDDITLIKNTPEYAGATAFQLDFLQELDYDEVNTAFIDKLPERLQQIIKNDEGLIIYMNPPYKSGCAKATDVGRHMIDIGLGAAAYDIYYQFMWRVMHFVDMFRLKNVWFSCFGPLTFFTGSGANVLLREYEKCFEFIDGMCLSAQEFSDTSDSIKWGIGCTLWKARGGYDASAPHKDILLDRKYRLPDGTVESDGKVLYAPPREKLSEWVLPKDVMFYEDAPCMTSHLTFRGGEALEKKAYSSGRIATNALGTLMIGNTLTRSADQSAILSMPTSIQFTSITEENFWRCVASYTFRRVIDADWAIAKKEISAPNENAEGYQEWLRNALVMFLFEWKSMMSSVRDVEFGGGLYNVRNKLFYLTEEEVRANCDDERILKDLEDNPPCNEFILKVIEECEPYWHDDVRQLYDWCKAYTLFSYGHRKDVDYKGSLEAWDAGFQQIRTGLWNEELQKEAEKRMAIARDFLRKDIMKFGFVSELEEE